MSKFKNVSVVLFAAVLAGVVISCKDEEKPDLKAEGVKAGIEMCDCVSGFEAPDPVNWEGTEDELQQAFQAYYADLGTCPGVLTKYQEYVTFVYGNYDPEAENPLYSVFNFKDGDFEIGFKEGTNDCMETFAALFELMGGQE